MSHSVIAERLMERLITSTEFVDHVQQRRWIALRQRQELTVAQAQLAEREADLPQCAGRTRRGAQRRGEPGEEPQQERGAQIDEVIEAAALVKEPLFSRKSAT